MNIFDSPEDFLVLPADAEFPIDAVNCVIARSEAVVLLLQQHFDGSKCDRLSDHVIANALWSVEGDLRTLKTMIGSAYQSMGQEVSQ